MPGRHPAGPFCRLEPGRELHSSSDAEIPQFAREENQRPCQQRLFRNTLAPMASPLAIVFMGTAPLAATILRALCADPNVVLRAVVTQPDKAKGRDLKLQPSAVKETALQAGLTVLQPLRARDEAFVSQLRAFEPELIIVAAYGQILPPSILELPRLGCLNVHTSLLPKYRGAAPIQWALLNDESETCLLY